eukprot:PhF_6_TR2235/c3_g6_i1/m.3770
MSKDPESSVCGGCYGAVEPLVLALQHHIVASLQALSSLTAMNCALLIPMDKILSSIHIDARGVVKSIERLRSRGLETPGGGAVTVNSSSLPHSWVDILNSLEDHVRDGRLHERVLRTFERFLNPSFLSTKLKDTDDLIEAAQVVQGTNTGGSGNVEKFGGDDLRSFRQDNLKPRDIPCKTLGSVNIFDAVRNIHLERLHEYRMCVACDRIVSTKGTQSHWLEEHDANAVEGGHENKFVQPSEDDLFLKMNRFWDKFMAVTHVEQPHRRPDYLGPEIGMTKDDVLAIYIYTLDTEIFADMNSALRDGKHPEVLDRYSGYPPRFTEITQTQPQAFPIVSWYKR